MKSSKTKSIKIAVRSFVLILCRIFELRNNKEENGVFTELEDL